MILTGVQVDAEEALRIGLVNKVVPPAELLPRATAMAVLIASFGRSAIRDGAEAVNITEEAPLSDGQKLEASLFGACCDTEDFQEGTRAFLEKRTPVFRNR